MSRNVGWSKKFADAMAKSCNTPGVEAYSQKEEHFYGRGTDEIRGTHQYIVILQKRKP